MSGRCIVFSPLDRGHFLLVIGGGGGGGERGGRGGVGS